MGLVLGSAGRGLRPLVRKTCDALVSIPLAGAGTDDESVHALETLRDGGRFTVDTTLEHRRISLPQGAFRTNLGNMRVTYNFTPQIFVQSLLQYNDRTDRFSTNLRFHWLDTAATAMTLGPGTRDLGDVPVTTYGVAPGTDADWRAVDVELGSVGPRDQRHGSERSAPVGRARIPDSCSRISGIAITLTISSISLPWPIREGGCVSLPVIHGSPSSGSSWPSSSLGSSWSFERA